MAFPRQPFSLFFLNQFFLNLALADLSLMIKWAGLLLIDLVFGPGGWLRGHFSSCAVYRGSLDLLGFGLLVDH